MSVLGLRHLRLLAIPLVCVAGSAAADGAVSKRALAESANDTIRLCHATGNGQWVSVEVAPEAVIGGHDGHDEDIIPPFTYEQGNDVVEYPGRNWGAEGQETWDADCVAAAPPTPVEYPIGVFGAATCETGGQTYAVTFGYDSENTVPVSIAVGPGNHVSPGAEDRGQPTTFQPGRVESAFTVENVRLEVVVTWFVTYGGETRSATVDAPSGCGEAPPPTRATVSVEVVCVTKGASTYAARFGYTNPGSATVSVAVGPRNRFSPGDEDRGQPIAFEPGTDAAAVTVGEIPNGTTLTWALVTAAARSATASDSFATTCEPIDPPTDVRPVVPYVVCVEPGPATFTATFGVDNPNDAAVTLPIGPANRFAPAPADRGQGTTFAPGADDALVTVTGAPNGTELAWTLDGRTATASASFARSCGEPPSAPELGPPDRPIGVFVACVTRRGRSYDAVFGYQNENAAPVTIAVGSRNRLTPAPENRGQPTVLLPGNVQRAFVVRDVPVSVALTWSLAHAAVVRSATATASHAQRCAERPEPLAPIGIFACVTPRGDSFDVTFGYDNPNRVAVSVPIGIANAVLPLPLGRGQPDVFQPGRVQSAFTVKGVRDSSLVVWTVAFFGRTSLAVSGAFPVRCGTTPRPFPIEIFPLCARRTGSTFVAVFGYQSLNRTSVEAQRGSSNLLGPREHAGAQPTSFRPGLAPIALVIRGVPVGRSVSWTLRTLGSVDVAVASVDARDCRFTAGTGAPDLSVGKVARPRTIDAGERVEYTIEVRNAGPSDATRVVAVDTQRGNAVELRSATASQGRCALRSAAGAARRVVCSLGTLGAGDRATILVAGRGRLAGTARNRVTVRSLPRDRVRADNTAVAVVSVRTNSVAGAGGPDYTG